MTIQVKATDQYFPVVLFIMLYEVALNLESVNEILQCGKVHSLSVIGLKIQREETQVITITQVPLEPILCRGATVGERHRPQLVTVVKYTVSSSFKL